MTYGLIQILTAYKINTMYINQYGFLYLLGQMILGGFWLYLRPEVPADTLDGNVIYTFQHLTPTYVIITLLFIMSSLYVVFFKPKWFNKKIIK